MLNSAIPELSGSSSPASWSRMGSVMIQSQPELSQGESQIGEAMSHAITSMKEGATAPAVVSSMSVKFVKGNTKGVIMKRVKEALELKAV